MTRGTALPDTTNVGVVTVNIEATVTVMAEIGIEVVVEAG